MAKGVMDGIKVNHVEDLRERLEELGYYSLKEAVLTEIGKGCTLGQIGDKLQVSNTTPASWLRKWGIPYMSRHHRFRCPGCKEQVRKPNQLCKTCRILKSCCIVRLTYFKDTGKYYSEGEFRMHKSVPMWKIWDAVRAMQKVGVRPGLIRHSEGFSTLIEIKGHPHDHPYLIIEEHGRHENRMFRGSSPHRSETEESL